MLEGRVYKTSTQISLINVLVITTWGGGGNLSSLRETLQARTIVQKSLNILRLV